ncbi:NAD-dependent epimerase/dehydratase family protein [Reichenbachiella carrageenanivorans]|uniref:NAD-dependent epimerase/dehydratase family protein n=1 Tax=Reichenbachiella carrageenanivorans TaxID=2979869 RepID=A0ABY6D4N1_9BACT|nr:NAD-dependent epimerase/dehydratase family protein [Reichenbachiella carrageenanivorans]UXX81117.1 NAD-dependent epimerase/dehydratase family protein [Reichenbachiella carrageenanivorans]
MPISLVTGGAGFIGSHVAEVLIAQSHKVIVLDDLSGGSLMNVPSKAVFVKGSITDPVLLAQVFDKYKIDYIYHLAAYAAEGLSHFIKRFNYQNNLIGSVNLINEAVKHEIKCFVFTSSIAVYGGQTPPMTEEMNPQPEDPYGIAKFAVEQELKVSKEMFGLDYVIFRPHNVYGERQNISDKYRNVIGIFMNQLMKGESLSVFGDGGQTRAFSYVSDMALVIAAAVENKAMYGEVFNIGADDACSVKTLAELVMQVMGVHGKINHLEERNEVQHAFASHGKLCEIVGAYQQTPLRDGLMKMAEWAKSSNHLPSKKFELLEISKKLPPFWK